MESINIEMNRVSSNFLYNISYHVVSLIIPLLVNPYVTRIISQELLGINTLIYAQASYFCILGTLGMNYYGTREIAKSAQEGTAQVSERFYCLYHIQFISYLLVIIIYAVFLIFVPNYTSLRLLYYLMILSSMTDINWLFMGMEQFKFIAIRNCLLRLISTGLVFLLIKADTDIDLYVICLYAPQLILNFMMWIYAVKRIGRDEKAYRISRDDIKKNIILAIPGIAISAYTILDRIVLGWFQPVESVAIYDQGQSIVRIVLSAVAAFGTVVMPRISGIIQGSEIGKKNLVIGKCAEFIWFLSSALMFGLIGISSSFISWYLPSNYQYVSKVILFSSPLILISSVENLMGVQILIPHGEEKGYSISLITAAVINFSLDLLLIPYFGIAAACFSSVIAEFVALIIQCAYVSKILTLKILFHSGLYYLLFGIVMCLVLVFLDEIITLHGIIKTAVLTTIGGIIYLSTCFYRVKKEIRK